MTVLTSFSSSSASNVSEEERTHYLDYLQSQDNRSLIPTVIFLVVVGVVGLCGNSIVLMVYSKKKPQTATDVFIMTMAVFDLLTNIIGIPNEIYDTYHYWDFSYILQCEFRVFINSFTTMTSALVLIAIAIIRYQKVCRPFGSQISVTASKYITIVIIVLGGLLATPQPILYGLQRRPTLRPDIFGYKCDVDDIYLHTIWPVVYAVFLITLFIGTYIPLIVLYCFVGTQAWRHSQFHGLPIASIDHFSDTYKSKDAVPRNYIFFKRRSSLKVRGLQYTERTRDGDGRLVKKKDMTKIDDDCIKMAAESNKAKEFNDSNEYKSKNVQSDLIILDKKANNCHQMSQHNSQIPETQRDENAGPSKQYNLSEENLQQYQDNTNTCVATTGIKNLNMLTKQVKKAILRVDSRPSENEYENHHNRYYEILNHQNEQSNIETSVSANYLSTTNPTITDHPHTSVANSRGEKTHTKSKMTRTTLMLLIISIVYVLAFLPYLVLVTIKFAVPTFIDSLTSTGAALCNLFLRMYFINCATNAIIYSFCNPRFRNEVTKVSK